MSNISVGITANVTDLQTKMALARSELRAFNTDTKSLADQVRVAGDAEKAALLPQLEASVTSAARAQTALGGLKGELDALSGGGGHGSISTATREFRALFDELSSGRTRYTPGTLAIIANRVFGLQASTLLAAGGVAALAGGLAYLAIKAAEASQQIDKIQVSAAFAGNMSLTRDQIEGLVTQVQRMADVSGSDARKIVGAFAGMKDETTPMIQALAAEVGDYMQATGEDATKAAETLTKAFQDPLAEGRKFLETIPKVTEQQLDAFDAAKRMGDANQAAAVMVQALDVALGRARGQIDAHRQSAIQDSVVFSILAGDTGDATGALNLQTQILNDNNKARQEQVKLLQQASQALKSSAPAPDMTLQLGVQAAQREDTTGTRIEKIKGDLQQMDAALAVAQRTGDQLNVDRLQAGIAAANRELQQLTSGGDHLAQFREQLSEMQAGWTGTHEAMLQQSVKMWAEELKAANLSAKERLQVEKGYADARKQLLQQEKSDEDAIRKSDADTELQISRIKIEAQKSALDAELQAHKITSQQKLEDLKQLTAEEYQLNLKALEDELALLKQQPVEYERVYNQIRVLKAREVADLAALDQQSVKDTNKEVKEESRAHRQMVQEVMGAEDSLVRGIFSGRQNLTQSLLSMGQSFVEREIANDLKYLTMKLLFNQQEATGAQSTETGGLLVHLFTESAKTEATAAGVAARTATVTAGAAAQQTAEATAGKQSVLGHAASAAAAVYDDVAQIPYVGWLLAPPAAAAAYAAVAAFGGLIPSFDVGSSMIGTTGLATVHEGEAIMPAQSVAAWQDGASSAGDTYNITIQAVDTQTGAQFLKNNMNVIVQGLSTQMRNANRSLRPATS